MAAACADWAEASWETAVGMVDAEVTTAGCQGRGALEATVVQTVRAAARAAEAPLEGGLAGVAAATGLERLVDGKAGWEALAAASVVPVAAAKWVAAWAAVARAAASAAARAALVEAGRGTAVTEGVAARAALAA